MLGCT